MFASVGGTAFLSFTLRNETRGVSVFSRPMLRRWLSQIQSPLGSKESSRTRPQRRNVSAPLSADVHIALVVRLFAWRLKPLGKKLNSTAVNSTRSFKGRATCGGSPSAHAL